MCSMKKSSKKEFSSDLPKFFYLAVNETAPHGEDAKNCSGKLNKYISLCYFRLGFFFFLISLFFFPSSFFWGVCVLGLWVGVL